ncbi:DUF1801 domain-containing protein [Reinekea marina]|uniref:DUF1801 domain-containing protein n=2 Tax=Reinekea marina TaxID=1310421 RepID=A0ABV7WV36_9GAMM
MSDKLTAAVLRDYTATLLPVSLTLCVNQIRRTILVDAEVKKKFDSYPDHVRNRLLDIRGLILEVAEADEVGEITEALKWGEPSYAAKKGSPIRIDWKPKNPEIFSIYFNCNTTLIETFREIYSESFQFVGNREMVFPLSEDIPISELKACISMSLRYHNIKHLPLLGA